MSLCLSEPDWEKVATVCLRYGYLEPHLFRGELWAFRGEDAMSAPIDKHELQKILDEALSGRRDNSAVTVQDYFASLFRMNVRKQVYNALDAVKERQPELRDYISYCIHDYEIAKGFAYWQHQVELPRTTAVIKRVNRSVAWVWGGIILWQSPPLSWLGWLWFYYWCNRAVRAEICAAESLMIVVIFLLVNFALLAKLATYLCRVGFSC